MNKALAILMFWVCTCVPGYSYGQEGGNGGNRPKPHEWQPTDMNSRMGNKIEADLNPHSWFCGFVTQCEFDLHYFFGNNYDGPRADRKSNSGRKTDPKRKWILFIPGGPGEIVDRQDHYLDFLSRFHNVVYFDVRGTGFSVIPGQNNYDQFLRSEYVVEDIEALRKTLVNGCSAWERSRVIDCEPGVKAWDAIYAHSWGTIVAQKYAARYRDKVKKLILSAPVSRGHRNTAQARRKMIVDNLLDIFERHRTTKCYWGPEDDAVINMLLPVVPGTNWSPVENFCFLGDEQKNLIRDSFFTLLNGIEGEYGSVKLVGAFYSQFISDRESEFWQKYPYPEAFFEAIKQLEDFGAGEKPGLRLDRETKKNKIGSAMYLAYYLSLPREALTDESHALYPGSRDSEPNCKESADFFRRLQDTEHDRLKKNFCNRIIEAWVVLNERPPTFNQSPRARAVFGVYDGLARWIFEIMKKERRLNEKGCFSGSDIQDVAAGDPRLHIGLLKSAVVREQARKLGARATDEICPWDPGKVESGQRIYHHDVDTLILKGGADATIAGEQAEYLFENGLECSKRALLEFPGAGHLMTLQVKLPREKKDDEIPREVKNAFRNLVHSFVTTDTLLDFVQDEKAKLAIGTLGASIHTDDKCFSN
jgi:pimeloyl-ACP methyl ester carboxylesterase